MDWVQVISTVGFPITAFLLIYLDLRRVVERNTQMIERLVNQIEMLTRQNI